MLRREYTPSNIEKNKEEAKYKSAEDSLDLSGISDAKTKEALEKILEMVQASRECNKKVFV